MELQKDPSSPGGVPQSWKQDPGFPDRKEEARENGSTPRDKSAGGTPTSGQLGISVSDGSYHGGPSPGLPDFRGGLGNMGRNAFEKGRNPAAKHVDSVSLYSGEVKSRVWLL